VWRIREAVVCLAIAAVAFNSDAGRIAADTKLDLAINPWGFLGRAAHIWDRVGYAGQLQNQAYGYFFPMGPFFGFGHSMHIPAWVVQRLWWTALLCVAFLGVVRLAERMGIGTPAARLVGGLAYALSPHVVSVLGPVSSEALPMCLTPWVLLPLVSAVQGGGIRRPVARSAVAVLFMGAINAAVLIAALIPAVVWLLTRPWDRRHVRLCLAWLGAVVGVNLWWVIPLLFLRKYSPPFLDYIENSGVTTSTTSLVEALRGTAEWIAYLPDQGWRAGYTLLVQPSAILMSALIVAVGLAGLTSPRLPHRRYLTLCLLVGVICLSAGFVGSVDGYFAHDVRVLLDGALAPLRNVHKFDVCVRLPLVLGATGVIGRVRWGRLPVEIRISRVAAVLVGGVVVLGAAAPFAALHTAPSGTFTAIPGYWRQAADWLHANALTNRALVVPGARFGYYNWGRPKDEPLQPLARSPWEVRDAVPFVPAPHIRMLDAIEDRLVAGTSSSGLGPYLAANGIGYLVVRNDLDYGAAGSPRPALVHAALRSSGLARVVSFGPPVGTLGTSGISVDQGLQHSYPAVEIFKVGAAAADGRASLITDIGQVSGGPESLLDVADAGLLSGPTVLTADGPSPTGGPVIVTDGLRRQERTFGRNDDAASQTLALTDRLTLAKNQRDYLGPTEQKDQAAVVYRGIRSVSASSSGSDAATLLPTVPGQQPFAAVDGDATTAWVSAPVSGPVGQWWQLDLDSPASTVGTTVQFTPDARVTQVQVTTQRGRRLTSIDGATTTTLQVPPGMSDYLRIRVTGVRPGTPILHQVGISTVGVPGLQASRTLVVPDDLPAGTAVADYVFAARDDARNGCVFTDQDVPLCAVGLTRPSEDEAGIDRTFTAPAPGSYQPTVVVVPRAGGLLEGLVNRLVRPAVAIEATSQAVPDPMSGPEAALDGSLDTAWVASPDDRDPTLTVRLHGRRTLTTLRLVTPVTLAATRPQSVTVQLGGDSQTVPLAADGTASFTPVTGSVLRLTLHGTPLRTTYDPLAHFPSSLGIGVAEVQIPGVVGTPRAVIDATPVRLGCGQAPPLVVDGQTLRTVLDTTVGALRHLWPMQLRVCGGAQVPLASGLHRLVAASTPLWRPTRVILESGAPPTAAAVPIEVRSWRPSGARVDVPARSAVSVLVVTENQNRGWHAELDNRRLRAVTVAGWQQGYVLPPGGAGTVTLTFAPDRAYLVGLLFGAGTALGVIILAVLPTRAEPGRRTSRKPRRRAYRWVLPLAGLGAAVLVGGKVGVVCWALAGLTVAALALLPRGSGTAGWIAGASAALAGALLAHGHWGTGHYAAQTGLAQTLCLVGLAVVSWQPAPKWPPGAAARTGAAASPVPPRTGSSTSPE
jgi:arabinofuranan 3-O-arabinosyltransferase